VENQLNKFQCDQKHIEADKHAYQFKGIAWFIVYRRYGTVIMPWTEQRAIRGAEKAYHVHLKATGTAALPATLQAPSLSALQSDGNQA
jgi:hypothetical protein